MEKNNNIEVLGDKGLVGSAIVRNLTAAGYENIKTPSHQQVDLTNQLSVDIHFQYGRPQYVFLAAAMGGGIHANDKFSAQFISVRVAQSPTL